MKDIIINKNEDGSNLIALVENGKLIEKYDDDESIKANEGNIYCGIVRDLLPGMQSAFVDIGEDKNAFIHIKDVIPKVSNVTGNKDENLEKYKIKDYLKVNMPVLVQVKKSEENLKGARVSTHISITGRLSVLMINVDFITVSQKIENKEERARLKKLASEILSELKEYSKYGLILRTSAENKGKAEIEKDVADLIEIWKKIKATYDENLKDKRPQLIFQNYDVISKFLVSVLETDVDRVIVNSKNTYETILEYLKKIGKENVEVVLNENEDLTQMHDIAGQIEEMKERKIWLKCGGFITIDKTEALTAIDINSGKFTGKKNSSKENTIYKVNQEATVEIAKQLRLRNISGIIVIDYIDMEEEKDRKNIMNLLEKELKKDRSKTQVMGFTKLDLLEMTRKKL
jgi:ribonuclease G